MFPLCFVGNSSIFTPLFFLKELVLVLLLMKCLSGGDLIYSFFIFRSKSQLCEEASFVGLKAAVLYSTIYADTLPVTAKDIINILY